MNVTGNIDGSLTVLHQHGKAFDLPGQTVRLHCLAQFRASIVVIYQ